MMDNLSDGFIERVQHIAQREARALLGAKCEVLFFDATTLYFEVNNSDELRKKDGVKMVNLSMCKWTGLDADRSTHRPMR